MASVIVIVTVSGDLEQPRIKFIQEESDQSQLLPADKEEEGGEHTFDKS